MGRSTRLCAVIGALSLMATIAACGGDDSSSDEPSTTVASTVESSSAPAATSTVAPEGSTTTAAGGPATSAAPGGDPCADVPAAQPLDERTKVVIAMPVKVQNFDHALVAEALGEFEAENIDAEIQVAQTPDIVTLLAQGRLDVGAIGLNVGILNAIAEGVDIRWVSGFTRVQDTDLAGFYVRSDWVDDPATFDAAKLDGAKIGIGVGGRSTQQLLDVQRVLGQADLTVDDVTLVELSSGDFGAAMQSHAIDAVTASNVQQIIDQGTGVKIAGIAPITAGGYFFSKALVTDKRDVGLAVMRALVRTQCTALQGNYYDDPATVDALVSTLEIPKESLLAQPPLTFDLRIADGSLDTLQEAWTGEGDLVQYDEPLTEDQVIDRTIYDEVTAG